MCLHFLADANCADAIAPPPIITTTRRPPVVRTTSNPCQGMNYTYAEYGDLILYRCVANYSCVYLYELIYCFNFLVAPKIRVKE